MPLSVLKHKSPYEILHNSPPVLDHIKTFGCLCYVSTSKVQRSKFDPRSDPCVFIGYSLTQKGYKILNLTTKRIYVNRDVVFHEKHFPYHYNLSKSSPSAQPFQFFLPVDTLPFIFIDPFTETSPYSSSSHTNTSPVSSTSHLPLDNPSPPQNNSSPQHIPSTSQLLDCSVPIPTTTSSRTSNPPSYLKDYVCSTAFFQPTTEHWCNLVKLDSIPRE